MEELLKRGLSFFEASMTLEAIYSAAIEGAQKPRSKEDWDHLVMLIKQERK
jgi:hypothetical protein